jgi:hypothetical protein
MKNTGFDLIGDIHGQHLKLTSLLNKLGYLPEAGGFSHPEGRQVVFLGDYIDRGPQVREVLQTVRAMVEGGNALALMGNHELNAVRYFSKDETGRWLRDHGRNNAKGMRATLEQFKGLDEEWQDWLAWMRRLPLFWEQEGFRAVHACWDPKCVERVQGQTLEDEAFLRASAVKNSPEGQAVELLLKGPEIDLPRGMTFCDKEGIRRKQIRVRWWNLPERAEYGELAMPQPLDRPGEVPEEVLREIPCYGPFEKPVFFGHYWLPASLPREPFDQNVACLDFSAAGDGPLVAYRWDGPSPLSGERFVESAAVPLPERS